MGRVMPYSENIRDDTEGENQNEAIHALETAFAQLGIEIEDTRTRSAIEIIARSIVAAILQERALTDHKFGIVIDNQNGIRRDLQELIAAIGDHKAAVSGRVHNIANHVMGVELRISELSELVTLHFDIKANDE